MGGGNPMSNELVIKDYSNVSLLDIRMDSKTYPRLFRYKREDAIFLMSKIVAQAFLYKGQAADPNNISFISTSLVDELLQEEKWGAKNLSMEEIARIVKQAVLTDNEMYGISVASLYKVIINWCKGDGAKLQREAIERKRAQESEALRNSVVAPMLQAYTGAFLKDHKINK